MPPPIPPITTTETTDPATETAGIPHAEASAIPPIPPLMPPIPLLSLTDTTTDLETHRHRFGKPPPLPMFRNVPLIADVTLDYRCYLGLP